MPIYEWKCSECIWVWSEQLTIAEYALLRDLIVECLACGGQMKRVFDFSYKPPMPEHQNASTGTYVTSERKLKDDLKRQSEYMTMRTGIEHNFVPVDHSDKQTLGITDEGLDATYNRRKELGMRIPDAVKPTSP